MHMCMCIALLHSSPPPPNSASLACLFWLLFLISRKLAVAHQDTPVCTALECVYRKLPAERCDAYGRDGAHASVRVRAATGRCTYRPSVTCSLSINSSRHFLLSLRQAPSLLDRIRRLPGLPHHPQSPTARPTHSLLCNKGRMQLINTIHLIPFQHYAPCGQGPQRLPCSCLGSEKSWVASVLPFRPWVLPF